MRFDFIVKYDPKTEDGSVLMRRIIYSLVVHQRLRQNKPCVLFISGDSGEGKTIAAIWWEVEVLASQGIELKHYVHDVNVYTPLEYPEKIDALLHSKDLKKVNVFCLQEAREIIKAKLWYDYINRTVADVNALSRAVKRLCFIIVSQFIRDIAVDIRYTLNYYITVTRPVGRRSRAVIWVLYKDDSNLEKPLLKKRRIFGRIILPNGKSRILKPRYFEIKMPDEEIVKEVEKADYEAKSAIIKNKLHKMLRQMKIEIGDIDKKIKAISQHCADHPETIGLIAKRTKSGWKLKDEAKLMYEMDNEEFKRLEFMLNEDLRKKDYMEAKQLIKDGELPTPKEPIRE